MTLKKQLFLLASIIIAIPALSVLFIATDTYIHSKRLYLTRDAESMKQLEAQEKSKANKTEKPGITDSFKYLPPELDSFLIDSNGKIVISTIKSIQAGMILDNTNIIPFLHKANGKYIYQFTTHVFEDGEYTLVTRIPKKNLHQKNPRNFFIPLLVLIAFLVSISVIILFAISRNMFRSIVNIQNQMSLVADGNLDVKIECDSTKTNEITSISNSLETMRKALQDAMNRKNKFIMGISHDLRTPIAVIKGYTEALEDGVITNEAEIKQTLGLIKSKINHLENMVNSLINFVKLDNNEIRKNLTPKPITKIINNFALDAKNTVGVFKRKLTSNINLPNEYMVPYDEQLVNRVFENLLSNALRYTEENDEIRICAYEFENSIYIKICDTGIGISETDLANIFDLFYRATNSRREEGMGIGLSVVKNIIETHGWNIEVQSEKGKGSCFTIIIPLQAQ